MSSEIEMLTPGVDPNGVYEIICVGGTVYTVAWATGCLASHRSRPAAGNRRRRNGDLSRCRLTGTAGVQSGPAASADVWLAHTATVVGAGGMQAALHSWVADSESRSGCRG
jgi:hypothetical protein